MEIIRPTEKENDTLKTLPDKIQKHSEMTQSQQQFLNALIKRHKPKKILELGVAAGSSSAIILNAINDIQDSKLISVDFSTPYYRNKKLKTGFTVDFVPDLKKKWTLLTGDYVCTFVDKIGYDVDFVFIDTMHINPGEILDFLMILPNLKQNAIVVFHDTALHTDTKFKYTDCITNCILMSTLKGKKLLTEMSEQTINNDNLKTPTILPNIGGVILDDDIKEHVWELFNLLSLPWKYQINSNDLKKIRKHFEKFYDEAYIKLFDKITEYQKNLFKNYKNSTNTVTKKPFKTKIKRTINILKHSLL